MISSFRKLCCAAGYHVTRNFWSLSVCVPQIDWLDRVEEVMHECRISDLKDVSGEPTTVVGVQLGGKKYVIKRYNWLNFKRVLKMCCRPSKARWSLAMALKMEQLGVKTPRVVGILERRFGPLFGEAYIVFEHSCGVNAGDYYRRRFMGDWEAWGEKIGQAMEKMRAGGIFHRDCKATNFLLEPEGVVVIDLDSVVLRRCGAREKARNEGEFLASIEVAPQACAAARRGMK